MEPDGAPKRDHEAGGEDELATRLSALRRASASLDAALAAWRDLRRVRTESTGTGTDTDMDSDGE